jgi:hypothetical protein
MRNFFLPRTNPAFESDLDSKISRIQEILQEFAGSPFTEYKTQLEKDSADLNETLGKIKSFLTTNRVGTEQGARSLATIRNNTVSFAKEAESLIELFQAKQSESILLQFNSLCIKWNVETAGLLDAGSRGIYPHWVISLFGFGFVFVPFLNILSLVLAIFQITLKDWRGRLFGTLTLICFLIQSLSVFKMAW